MAYPVELCLFIVCAIFVGAVFLILFFGPIVKRFLYRKRTIQMYYKRIYKVALDQDFYLINSFSNKTADEEEFHIDHILIGDKFIYCIRDRYYEGAIKAKENDPSWVYYSKKNKAGTVIQNPLRINEIRVQRMSLMSGLNRKLFISVVLVNDDCLLSHYEVTSSNSFVVSLKNFPAFIAEKESLPIEPMDPRAIAVAAKDIAELNLHGKEK